MGFLSQEHTRLRARALLVARGAETAHRCLLSELGSTDVQSPATLVIGAVAALDVTALATVAELRP